MACEKLLVEVFVLFCLPVFVLQNSSGYLIFTKEPEPVTLLYTKELSIECAATNADLYQWLLNDTEEYLYDSDIDTSVNTVVEGSVKISTLTTHPPHAVDKLNNTIVQCVAINHIPGELFAQINMSKEALIRVQGKLDPPEINEVYVNCPSRTFTVSWNQPITLPGIPVSGYEVCSGEKCSNVSSQTLSWSENISIAKASTCEVDVTRVAALIEEEKGYYAIFNTTFTQGPDFIEEHQIESEVVFLADNQMFQIVFKINLYETDVCHLPDGYRVTVSYANSNSSKIIFFPSLEMVNENDDFKQKFAVNVTGQNTDVFFILDPQNCIGSNTSMPVKNRLSHLQSVVLNNNYVTCTFAKGSNAIGCETVSTCNTSAPGKAVTSKVTSLIKLDPSYSYATGKIIGVEISDCLTYDVSVYEVLADGSMGVYVAKIFSNITFSPGSSPTSNYDGMPTPSSSTITPTENSEDTVTLIIINLAVLVVTFLIITVGLVAILIYLVVWRRSKKQKDKQRAKRAYL